jgi:hypothetical protein
MTRSLLFVALILAVSGGCRKVRDRPEPASSGNQGGSGFGAEQAVRGAVKRVVTAAELKDLHLFMNTRKLSSGRVPTGQETWAALNEPGGNPQLVQLIKDQVLILVPNPPEEGLWAYAAEAPTQGGWVLTHSEPKRVTAAEFRALQQGN